MKKYFCVKIWFVTSLCFLVGATALMLTAHLLNWFFGSCRETAVWLLANSGHIKSAFITFCLTVFLPLVMFYVVRSVRAGALWVEAKSRKEREL